MRVRRPLVTLSIAIALALSMLGWSGAAPAPAAATSDFDPASCGPYWAVWTQTGDQLDPPDQVIPRDEPSTAQSGPLYLDVHTPLSGPSGWKFRLYSGPSHAKSFDLSESGMVDYEPEDGYLGADSFEYVLQSGLLCTSTATVVLAAPTRPRPVNDVVNVWAGEVYDPLDVCGLSGCGVLANDLGPAATIFRYKKVNEYGSAYTDSGQYLKTEHGEAKLAANGHLTYTPDTGFVGEDAFYYISWSVPAHLLSIGSVPALDGATLDPFKLKPLSPFAKVTLNVMAPPTVRARDDGPIEVTEDTPQVINAQTLLANDSGLFSVLAINSAANGVQLERTPHATLRITWTSPTGCTFIICFDLQVASVTYEPDLDFNGHDEFQYTTSAGSAKVVLDVQPVEDPPVVNGETATTKEDTAVTLDLTANDTDPDGNLDPSSARADPCTIHICLYLTSHGSWIFNGDGTVTFTPDPEFTGPTGLDYLVSDTAGNTAIGKVRMTVLPDAAVDDVYAAIEDTPLVVPAPGVLANDDPPASGPASATLASQPEHGSVTLAPDGSFDYTPAPNFAGTDTFTYVGPDGDTGDVRLDVAPVNDAPVVVLNGTCDVDAQAQGIICIGDFDDRYVDEGQAVQLRGSVEDVELSPGAITIDWGDGTSDTIDYPCSPDSCLESEPAWYNACGLFGECGDRLFFERSHVYVDGPAGRSPAFAISAVATETNGPSSSAATGYAKVNNLPPSLTLAASCTSSGVIFCSGVFSALDVGVGQDVTLRGRVTDPGIEPVAIVVDWGDGTTSTIEADCSTAGAPCPSEPLQSSFACLFNEAGCGYFSATHLYAGVSGAGGFHIGVEATDADGESDTTGTVAHVIDPPPVVTGFSVTTDEDTAVGIDLAPHATDTVTAPGDLGITALTDPAHGGLTGAGSSLSYQPDGDYSGSDEFDFQACDELDQCASATVTITVNPVNDPPHAVDDAATTDEDVPVTLAIADLIGNDSDVDNTLAANGFSIAAGPSHGAVTDVAGGVRYTPDADWSGSDSFDYEICDAAGGCATATVMVNVNPVNDAPLVHVSGPGSVSEGSVAEYSFTVSDVDPGDTFDVVTDSPSCDGGTLVSGSLQVESHGGSFHCSFADGPASESVSVTVADAAGTPDDDATTTVVNNVSPSVTIQSLAAGQAFVPVEFELTLEATFTDPGDDTHSATVEWGDGSTSRLASVARSGFSASHAYDDPDTYEITVTVTDSDGSDDVVRTTVEVVDTEQAIGGAADQLAGLLSGSSADTAVLLQDAIDDLVGSNDGTATNGALDHLLGGDPLTAVNKLYAAEQALDAIADVDVDAQQGIVAQIARVVTVQTVQAATAAIGCDPTSAKTCSRGERKTVGSMEGWIETGDGSFAEADYPGAVYNYLKAVKTAAPLL